MFRSDFKLVRMLQTYYVYRCVMFGRGAGGSRCVHSNVQHIAMLRAGTSLAALEISEYRRRSLKSRAEVIVPT